VHRREKLNWAGGWISREWPRVLAAAALRLRAGWAFRPNRSGTPTY